MSVPIERIYGTYKTSYPFGVEAITLKRNGTFAQDVAIHGQPKVSIEGRWEFDSHASRVNFSGLAVVEDPSGRKESQTWKAQRGNASFDVEMHWFQIVMGSGLPHPYYKQ